jgi:hypothetical protein
MFRIDRQQIQPSRIRRRRRPLKSRNRRERRKHRRSRPQLLQRQRRRRCPLHQRPRPSHLPRLRLRHRRRASVSHLFPVLTGDFTRRRLRWLPRGPGTNSSVYFSWKIRHSRSRHLSCHRRCSPQVIASRRHRRHQCLRRRRRWPLRRHRLLAMPRQSPVCCRCYFRRSRAAANDRVARAAITADQNHAAKVAPVTPRPTSRHRYLLRGA